MRPLCANACFNLFLIYHLFAGYEFHATYVEVRKQILGLNSLLPSRGSEGGMEVIRLGGKHPHLLSCVTSPNACFKEYKN